MKRYKHIIVYISFLFKIYNMKKITFKSGGWSILVDHVDYHCGDNRVQVIIVDDQKREKIMSTISQATPVIIFKNNYYLSTEEIVDIEEVQ